MTSQKTAAKGTTLDAVHTATEELGKGDFSVHTKPKVILYLCLRKTRSGKSRDYCDAIIFEKLRFQNIFCPQEKKVGVFKFLRFD